MGFLHKKGAQEPRALRPAFVILANAAVIGISADDNPDVLRLEWFRVQGLGFRV